MSKPKPTFESLFTVIDAQVEKRRGSWRLAAVPWDDAKQIILTRVFLKFPTFDPDRGEFPKWLSRVITNTMLNILRDNLQKWSRPCIQGCPFNMSGNDCEKTPSGKQCDECPAYREWKKKKQEEFNIRQPLPYDTHASEVESIQSDFLDIEEKKKVIDDKMKARLTRHEWRVYKLLIIKHKTEEEVGLLLNYKESPGAIMHAGYQSIRKMKKKFVMLAKKIIEEENLVR
jgi:DNA-directed RNA polymerase specialized sigma24 family protein